MARIFGAKHQFLSHPMILPPKRKIFKKIKWVKPNAVKAEDGELSNFVKSGGGDNND